MQNAKPGTKLAIGTEGHFVRNAAELGKQNGVEIPFPIIEDISMKVATAYGMVHPGASDTQAVRVCARIRA